MQDGFEKEIQKRMRDFNLEPSPEVWNEIDTALGEKKRRRFILWWWLLPFMLAGGSIVWFYYANYKSNAPSAINNQKEKMSKNKNQSMIEENKNEATQEEGYARKQDEITNSKQFGPHRGDISDFAERGVINKNRTRENKIDQSGTEVTRITEPSELNKKNILQNDAGINSADKNADSAKKEPALSVDKKDSSVARFLIKDSAGKAAQMRKNEVSIKKRGNWLITIGAGIAATKEHGSSNLLDPDKSFSQLSADGSGNYSSSPDSTNKIIKPDNGFHFTAGILYQYPLSKKWIVSSGLQYRFLTNKQKAGKYIDSSGGNYSSLISVTQYYQAGYTNNISNKAYWLEIPLSIAYTINSAAKTKLQLSGGASYAWMFADKWLIPDSRSNKLYYSKQLLNKNIFNWQTGAAITFSPGWRIGLQYQQSISTLADKSVEPHLYWQNFSLHSAFPFQIKNHKQ